MPLYSKPSKEMVFDLINEANPTLTIPVTMVNVTLGTPVAIGGVSWPNNNTSIVASPMAGVSDYIGRQTLTYRRLDLGALFRGQQVQINKFKSTTNSTSGSVMYTVYQLLADINSRYGLNLTQDDIVDGNIQRGSTLEGGQYTTTVTVAAKATSLGYTGTFQLKWLNTKQSLEDMITVRELPGRVFPGGNDFSGAHKDILLSSAFGIDFSAAMKATNPGWAGGAWPDQDILGSGAPGVAQVRAFLQLINQKCGTNYTFSDSGSYQTTNEVRGFTWQGVVLPNVGFAEANSTDFNRIVLLTAPADCPWATGSFMCHLNYPL